MDQKWKWIMLSAKMWTKNAQVHDLRTRAHTHTYKTYFCFTCDLRLCYIDPVSNWIRFKYYHCYHMLILFISSVKLLWKTSTLQGLEGNNVFSNRWTAQIQVFHTSSHLVNFVVSSFILSRAWDRIYHCSWSKQKKWCHLVQTCMSTNLALVCFTWPNYVLDLCSFLCHRLAYLFQ